jgi:thioredoxin 1
VKKAFIVSFLLTMNSILFSQNPAGSEGSGYQNMSMEEFNKKINGTSKLVLVDFEADWCALCKKLKPIMQEIATERKDRLDVLSINTDNNPKIAKHFEVDGLPLMLLYKNGQIIWSNQGFMSKPEILGTLDHYQK